MNPFKIIKETAESVTGIVDKFVATPEEKAEIKKQVEEEITKRWVTDTNGSWLTRSVRPLSLIAVLVVFFIMLFTDGNVGSFTIQKEYIPVYQILLITIVGGYFAVRTIDKKGRIK
jgi:hypothetical protein